MTTCENTRDVRAGPSASHVRKSFSIPASDIASIEWCERQENLSMSIRRLIRDDIERRKGAHDVFFPRDNTDNSNMKENET